MELKRNPYLSAIWKKWHKKVHIIHSYGVIYSIIAVVLLLLLVLMAVVDGVLTTFFEWIMWRFSIAIIVIIIYFLVVYPFMMRLREQAVMSFKPLLPLEDDAFNRLATDISQPNRQWE